MAPKKKAKASSDAAPELLDFGWPSYVSQRGLEHVLTTVAQRGLPEHLSRRSGLRERTRTHPAAPCVPAMLVMRHINSQP